MDSSAIPSYYVSKAAKQYVTVVLNGDGADELFGGYRRYVPITSFLMNFSKLFGGLRHCLPQPRDKQSLYNYIYRLFAMSNKKGLGFYLSATSDVFEDVLHIPNNPIFDQMQHFISATLNNKKLSALSQFLYLDFNLLLFSDLLVKMDIATMANSVEGRSPFLSKYMLDLAPRLPDHLKINRFKTKYILRKLAEKYLSPDLINQPKRGFEVPLKKWVNHELRDNIYDHLSTKCYAENFIPRSFINSILDKKMQVSEEKRAKILWSLFCLEIWHRQATT